MRTISDDAPRCPFPHEPMQHDDPQWRDAAHQLAVQRAHEHAQHSHVDSHRASTMAQRAVEERARSAGVEAIDEQFVQRVGTKLGYGHPLSERTGTLEFTWTPEAEARLSQVPEFCRELTRWRVEWTAHKRGLGYTITPEIMETKYAMWGEVSQRIEERHVETVPWTDAARDRLARIPDFVRGQVIDAVEGNARRLQRDVVDDDVVDDTISRWTASGDFHEGRYGFR